MRRNMESINIQRILLAEQMKASSINHPEISRRLVPIYMEYANYIQGQPIDLEKTNGLDISFHEWAKGNIEKTKKLSILVNQVTTIRLKNIFGMPTW